MTKDEMEDRIEELQGEVDILIEENEELNSQIQGLESREDGDILGELEELKACCLALLGPESLEESVGRSKVRQLCHGVEEALLASAVLELK